MRTIFADQTVHQGKRTDFMEHIKIDLKKF
jgi:hypothetical protein